MERRRALERFALQLPMQVSILGPGERQATLSLRTRDVSAKGAFFAFERRVPIGTRVKLQLTVTSERLKSLTGAEGRVEIGGIVVRNAPNGIAVAFDANYAFSSRQVPGKKDQPGAHPF